MISSIEAIGERLGNKTFLDNKIQSIKFKNNTKNSKNKYYICTVDISTHNPEITFTTEDINESNKESKAKNYLWIGNSKAKNPQKYFTSNKLKYIFQSLINNLGDPKLNTIQNKLEDIKNLYYVDKFLRLNNVKVIIENKSYYVNFINPKEKLSEYYKKFETEFKKQTENLHNYEKDIVLYVAAIDNDKLVDTPEYKNFVIDSLNVDNSINYFDGICSICGKNAQVTDNTTKLTFKYYNTDKNTFASNLIDFRKNFLICNNCYNNIINGENFIKKNLTSSLGYSIMIIPEESFNISNYSPESIKSIFNFVDSNIHSHINNNIKNLTSKVTNIENITKNDYSINILFYEAKNNEFKILYSIIGIPFSRFKEINNGFNDARNNIIRQYDTITNSHEIYIDISDLFKLLSYDSKKDAIDLITKIIKKTLIEKDQILRTFIKNIAYWYYENKYISSPNLLKMNAYIYFLINQGIYPVLKKEENNMAEEKIEEKEEKIEEKIFENMKYSKEQEGLFYMGYTINLIGYIIYKDFGINKNPLLDKINYQGMDFSALEKLAIAIDEKIKQYGIYGFKLNKNIFNFHSIMSEYVGNRGKKWPLSNIENVFLIMTGYSSKINKSGKNDGDQKSAGNIGSD